MHERHNPVSLVIWGDVNSAAPHWRQSGVEHDQTERLQQIWSDPQTFYHSQQLDSMAWDLPFGDLPSDNFMLSDADLDEIFGAGYQNFAWAS